MLSKIKELAEYMNSRGIPVPVIRNTDGKPSVSLTLLILSSIFVMMGLLSFAVPWMQVSFVEALAWHVTSAVLYYNRGAKISKDGISIDKE